MVYDIVIGAAGGTRRAAHARISAMGFNPFRQQRRRSSDYMVLAAAFALVAALLVWALVPR